jgi:WD40 repeat protein
VGSLRLLVPTSPTERHEGEVYSCAYTPDGEYVVSGGWDGQLRLWGADEGTARLAVPTSPKPLSACRPTPDGQQWLAGSMEGLLTVIDGATQTVLQSFVAHTRPISGIAFSPDGQQLVTASWDRQVTVRQVGKERDGRNFGGHSDIVAGCRFTCDGNGLVSWSYDGTIKLWDLELGRETATLSGHTDRVVTLALSPDGRHALSGGRDGTVRLWDLDGPAEVATVNIGVEVRACFFLLDAESVVIADGAGRLFLMTTTSFQVQAQVQAPFKAMCGDLAPGGAQLALGGEDGVVHFLAVEGLEEASLVVTPKESVREEASFLGRVFGRPSVKRTLSYTCPACRRAVEAAALPPQTHCPFCRRSLRVHVRTPALQGR